MKSHTFIPFIHRHLCKKLTWIPNNCKIVASSCTWITHLFSNTQYHIQLSGVSCNCYNLSNNIHIVLISWVASVHCNSKIYICKPSYKILDFFIVWVLYAIIYIIQIWCFKNVISISLVWCATIDGSNYDYFHNKTSWHWVMFHNMIGWLHVRYKW